MARRRPKKKKSGAGIWIGMGCSLVALAGLIVVLYFQMQPKMDDTTKASSDKNLAKKTLPADLPDFGTDFSGSDSDCSALMGKVAQTRSFFAESQADTKDKLQKVSPVFALMKKAAGSDMSDGFLDKRIPAKLKMDGELKFELEALRDMVDLYIDYQLNQSTAQASFKNAHEVAAAYALLGKKLFENNVRLEVRQWGLGMMRTGVGFISTTTSQARKSREMSEDKAKQIQDDVQKWTQAVNGISQAWNDKLKSNESRSKKNNIPNIGDLVKIAKKDEDRTFKVYAALRLGYARFERGDEGNQKAIYATLEELKKSDDDMVAEAAKAGLKIEEDEYQSLHKNR